ncbi:MAG: hypothetical protein ACK5HS_02695 [Mycoplasmatales bacterium]
MHVMPTIIGITFATLLSLIIVKISKGNNKIFAILCWLVIASAAIDRYMRNPSYPIWIPFHLCDLALIISGFALYFNNKKAYKLILFLLWGSIFAILFPQPSILKSPLFSYTRLVFYLDHALVIATAIILTKQNNWWIEKGDWKFAFTYVFITGAIMMYIVNPILGTNFYFVSGKLDIPIFNLFLPWPYYPYEFAILAIIIFILYEKILLKIKSGE